MPAPLVVALHGCTQTASDFAAGTRFDSVAERAGAYVVYPEQSISANSQRCWNWFLEQNQYRTGGEPAEIISLVNDLLDRYPIDRNRVFVAGLSAGAAMTAILAEQAPDMFAAVGIMAGVRLHASRDEATAHAAMRGMLPNARVVPALRRGAHVTGYDRLRVSVWTGANDRLVAPVNASMLAEQFLALLSLDDRVGERERREKAQIVRYRDAKGRVRIETWSIEAMGHCWSGGSFRGSHTCPGGPRASDEMMAFFLDTGTAVQAGESVTDPISA